MLLAVVRCDNVKAKIQDKVSGEVMAVAQDNIKAKIQDKVQEVLMAVVGGDNVKAQIQDKVNEVLLAGVQGDNVKAKVHDQVRPSWSDLTEEEQKGELYAGNSERGAAAQFLGAMPISPPGSSGGTGLVSNGINGISGRSIDHGAQATGSKSCYLFWQ